MLAVIKRYPDHVSANFRQHPTERDSEQTFSLIRLVISLFVLLYFLTGKSCKEFWIFALLAKS